MIGEEKISGDVKNEGYPLGEGYVDIRDLMERFIDSYTNNSHRTEEARRVHDQEHRHLLYLITHTKKADVAPVVRAEWIEEEFESNIPIEFDMVGRIITHKYINYKCSNCGRTEPYKEPYCHCGAKMIKEEDFNEAKENI